MEKSASQIEIKKVCSPSSRQSLLAADSDDDDDDRATTRRRRSGTRTRIRTTQRPTKWLELSLALFFFLAARREPPADVLRLPVQTHQRSVPNPVRRGKERDVRQVRKGESPRPTEEGVFVQLSFSLMSRALVVPPGLRLWPRRRGGHIVRVQVPPPSLASELLL